MRGLKRPPSPEQLLKTNRVNLPNESEAIWQPLYDYQEKVADAVSTQRFFQTPVGQAGKDVADTNMELAGQIPKGQAFLITGIQVEFFPETSAQAGTSYVDDVLTFYKSGALILTIGSKEFAKQGNLMKFSPVNRLVIEGDVSDGANTITAAAGGREYSVNGLTLESSQNFNVDLVDLPATINAARVGVTLNGWLYRNAQ